MAVQSSGWTWVVSWHPSMPSLLRHARRECRYFGCLVLCIVWSIVNTFEVTGCSHTLRTLLWAGIVPSPARGMVSEGVGTASTGSPGPSCGRDTERPHGRLLVCFCDTTEASRRMVFILEKHSEASSSIHYRRTPASQRPSDCLLHDRTRIFMYA